MSRIRDVVSPRLINFFLQEIDHEESSDFSRLSRIPDTQVQCQLAYYRSLSDEDRRSFRDCCAHWACACYGFVVNAGMNKGDVALCFVK